MSVRSLLGLAALVSIGFLACDEATPVAPVGSTLTISANPTIIEANGQAEVTVLARKADGTPVNPGTQIFLSSTLGSIEEVVPTDPDGVAKSTLVGDGRIGTATVTATSGATETVSTEVQIGSPAGSITLQPTPTTISDEIIPGEEPIFTLVSTVRDETGQPLVNAAVTFQTDLGTLTSLGGFVFTDVLGEARDTLTVSADDISALEAPSFLVSAFVAGADGILLEASFSIQVRSSAPIAAFSAEILPDFMVFFRNNSTGAAPLTCVWDFGDNTSSTDCDPPTKDYGSANTFTVILTVENDFGSDVEVMSVTSAP